MRRRTVLAAVAALSGGCLGAPGAPDGGTTPTLAERSFHVTAAECGEPTEAASASFDADEAAVTVTGTTTGPDGCYLARLANAAYDADADELAVTVEASDASDPGEGCVQCLTELDYEARLVFAGGLPGRVVVVHESRGETRPVATVER